MKAGFAEIALYTSGNHGFGYALIFVKGKQLHSRPRKEADPDIRLSGSGFLSSDEALASAASVAKGLKTTMTNLDVYKDYVKKAFSQK